MYQFATARAKKLDAKKKMPPQLDPSLNDQGIFDTTKHEMIFMQYISSISRPVRGSLTHPGQCLDVVQGILRLEGRLARVEGDEAAACNRKKEKHHSNGAE